MSDRRLLVQFLHPGGEHEPDGRGEKGWNTGRHKRKFLVSPGRYLGHDPQPGDGKLVFWGEWEPQSRVVKEYCDRVPNGPRWLYEPYYSLSDIAGGLDFQNTDPFVFGDQFLYTGCLQNTKRGATQLRSLARGSIVLFGSCLDLSRFVIDTVFVVDRWIEHTASDHRRPELRNAVPKTYCDVTLDRWYSGCSPPQYSYRLYFGATPENPVDGTFSFFPCMPETEAPRGFARPTIALEGRVTQNHKQGHKATALDASSAVSTWNTVVAQVQGQGLCLGVRARMPPLATTTAHSQ
jgi:hypothetical protein